jgi:tRNA threonylcarbamoyl adenosine modification protein YeaZ/ribosomal-protein-alanine acetyltransferase
MTLLAIDTCFGCCSAALFNGHVVAERHAMMDTGHAEALAPMVQALLADAGLRPKDLTRIAVTIGPGTFTGVRIGLSFARGLALALKLPLIGIDSLAATAAPYLGKEAVSVAYRAGASQFSYVARFGAEGEMTLAPQLVAEADVAGLMQGRLMGSALGDVPVAAKFIAHVGTLGPSNTPPEPLYLRAPDAKPQPQMKRAAQVTVTSHGSEAALLLATLHASSFDHPWTEQSFVEMLGIPVTQALVAQTEMEPAGFLLTRMIADETEILTICTAPHLRQRGVGHALLKHFVAETPARKIHLEVASDNDAALALYRSLGFKQVGLRKGYYKHADAILMSITRSP